MQANRIVVIGRIPEWAQQELTSQFVLTLVDAASREELLAALKDDVVALIARGALLMDEEVFEAAPRLRVVARTGVGYDTVDVPAATGRGIPVIYTPGAMSRSVAEHTLGLILSAVKDFSGWHGSILRGLWQERYSRLNGDLEGATVAIIGLGRIGRLVRSLLRPFNARVLVDDPYLNPADFAGEEVRFVSLQEALSQSDIITLHVPLNEETRGLIRRDNIAEVKRGAVLVNTARGGVIESNQMVFDALEAGILGYFAADVLEKEPPDLSDPLLRHPRALLTAHIASRTPLAQRRVLESMLLDLKALLRGARPREDNVVNPETLPSASV
jgi:D-3-phosphoglycerate dehydrogenase / 2-oxoglutarate reductase